MLCCVIASAIMAFISARLATLPLVGPLLSKPRKTGVDASAWRLYADADGELAP